MEQLKPGIIGCGKVGIPREVRNPRNSGVYGGVRCKLTGLRRFAARATV